MDPEFNGLYAAEQLRRSRHPLRRLVKNLYLRNILRHVSGPSIDFGCGAGQLLKRLPVGSVGLEINPLLVAALRDTGLDVRHYDPDVDRFTLADLAENRFTTLIMAHVLEHFAEASRVLRALLASCVRLRVQHVILVLPGQKGYLSDPTHKTFVDRNYLNDVLASCAEYKIEHSKYFPLNYEAIGRYFTFHELILVLARTKRA